MGIDDAQSLLKAARQERIRTIPGFGPRTEQAILQALTSRSANEIYEAVGLLYIEPELRENQGEIEAARSGGLPVLIEPTDIRGDLHTHTVMTDGKSDWSRWPGGETTGL